MNLMMYLEFCKRLITPDREKLIPGIGRLESIEDLKKSVINPRNVTAVKIEDLAEVKIGAATKLSVFICGSN